MISPKPALRAYVMLAFVMLFWSGNSIVGRAFRDDISPFVLALVRWSGALVLLLPFAFRHVVAEWGVIRRNWPPILLLGLVGVATFNGLLYTGLHDTTAANALLLQALIPALVLLIGAALFRDRASRGQIAGVILSTIGVAVIVFRGDPAAIIRLHFGIGDGLILCACVAWAIYTACLRLRPPIHAMSLLFSTFFIGAVAMIPLALTELEAVANIDWRASIFAAFAYVAIFPSVLAYFLYNSAVARIGPGPAGQTISLMPLFGAGLATLLLGEPLHAYHAAGMAAILAGVLVTGYASPSGSEG